MEPKVSIVCVTYSRRELALRCLKSCVEQSYPDLEIVLVINPSGDGTEEAIGQNFPQIKVIRTHKNIGFFPALNIAIANTAGDYIMTVDDDAYFLDDKAIVHLVAEFQREPKLGAVTCNLEGPHETPIDADRYIEAFTTGFTMVPRRVFTEWVGYYPDILFREAGEPYLCSRLWEMGRPIKRIQKVKMYHAYARQGRPTKKFKFYALRDQILCAVIRDPWILILPRLLSKLGKSFLALNREGYLWVWLLAWLDALYRMPEAFRLRDPIRLKTQLMLWRLRKETPSTIPWLKKS